MPQMVEELDRVEKQPQSLIDSEIDSDDSKSEKSFPHIVVTFTEDGVKIGNKGQTVKFPTPHNFQKNYNQHRREVLKVLIVNAGGQPILVKDLWERAIGDEPFDSSAMLSIRNWLTKLTFRRQKLVSHNGVRGEYSGYFIKNPNVSFVEESSTTDQLSTASEVTEEVQQPVEKDKINFPVDEIETLIFIKFLETRAKALENAGIPILEILDSKVDEMLDSLDINSLLEAKYGGDLNLARKSIIKTVISYFEDEYSVFEDIAQLTEEDVRFDLLAYLFELNTEQRKQLLSEVAEADPDIVAKLLISRKGMIVKVVVTDYTNGTSEAPESYTSIIEDEITDDLFSSDSEPTPVDLTEDIEVAISQKVEEVDVVEPIITKAVISEPSKTSEVTHEKKKQTQKWEIKLRQDVKKSLDQLIADGAVALDDSLISVEILRNFSESRLVGTEESLKRAVTNNIIKSESVSMITLVQAVSIAIQNPNAKLFSAPKNSKKRQRVDSIIIEAIEEQLNELEQIL